MPNPKDGAPFVSIALPFLSMIFVADMSTTLPVAASTLSTPRTRVSIDSGTGSTSAWSPWKVMSADLELTTASVPAYDSWKIVLKALSIVSVRTNVPETIATPRTIASAVAIARNFRPARPRRATRITAG